MTPKLKALAALWIAEENLAATIEALETERDRVGRAVDELNADEYSIADIEDAMKLVSAQEKASN